MAQDKKKAQYEPPTSQVDLAARLESGNASDRVVSTSNEAARRDAEQEVDEGRIMIVEGNVLDGYVGVDPIYQNYANKTEAPLTGDNDKNPENALFEEGFGQMPQRAWEIDDETVAKLQKLNEDDEPEEPTGPDGEETTPQLSQPTPGDNS
jgi:hypothetical protein